MDSMALNVLDIGAIVTLLLSGLVGLALGFVKSGLFVLSWIGAIGATVVWFPMARPYGHRFIETPWMADVAAGAALFLVALTVLFLISSVIGSWVRTSRLNALDRSLGMLAGFATAVLIVCSLYVLGESVWPEDEQPVWMVEARSLPLIKAGAEPLRSFIRGAARDAARGAEEKARKMLETEKLLRDMLAPPPKGAEGTRSPPAYGSKERRGMDKAIESVR